MKENPIAVLTGDKIVIGETIHTFMDMPAHLFNTWIRYGMPENESWSKGIKMVVKNGEEEETVLIGYKEVLDAVLTKLK